MRRKLQVTLLYLFQDGTGAVTATNASGICDGVGAVIVASEQAVKERNLKPPAFFIWCRCMQPQVFF